MSRYDHKIETSLEGIEHLSKEKKENKEEEQGQIDGHHNEYQAVNMKVSLSFENQSWRDNYKLTKLISTANRKGKEFETKK